MSIPKKHHFLPQFYLKRWAAASSTKKIYLYTKPHTRVVVNDRSVKNAGYREHLYSIKSRSDGEEREEIEKTYLADLDYRASKALDKMEITGKKPLDKILVDGWSRFILSQITRSPDRIAWLEDKLRSGAPISKNDLEEAYNTRRDAESPAFEVWAEKLGSDLTEEAKMFIFRSFIDGNLNKNSISSMKWCVHSLRRHTVGFLVSDNPVMISNGIGQDNGFVILPLGPAKVLIAAHFKRNIDAFIRQNPMKLEYAFNDALVRQADSMVIGHTADQLQFVAERFLVGKNEKQGYLDRMFWEAP